MTTSRLIVLALSGAAAVTLAACSSSAAGTGGSAPAVHTTASSGAAASTASHDAGSPINPCTTLTIADVQPLLTPKLGSTKAGTQPLLKPNDLHTCTFLSADGDDLLTVSTYVSDSAPSMFDQFRQSEDSPTDVPGVGAKAYRGDENAQVTALSGDVMCIVDVARCRRHAGADRLYDENGHHTDIGAPAFDVIAKADGTLCNRIFGSGDTTPDLSGLTGLHPPKPTD